MSPDDPRHGRYAGYIAGCREFCCRRAAADYQRKRYFDHRVLGLPPRHVDKTGTVRRVQALQRLGWSAEVMSHMLGHSGAYLNVTINRDGRLGVHQRTAEKVRDLYERLSMTIGPSDITRRRALRAGWAPPMAWDDDTIDDPNAAPDYGGEDTDVDPVVVMRLLGGDRIKATKAEKEAALAQWVADGGTIRELCKHHGWNDSRYKGGLTLVRGGAA